MTANLLNFHKVANTPPGAGRTFLGNIKNAIKPLLHRGFRILRREPSRQLAAERRANMTRRDGETAGTVFTMRSRAVTP